MAAALFTLPPEIRHQIYRYVFAGSRSVFEFGIDTFNGPSPSCRSFVTISSTGDTALLLTSKQYYLDVIDDYHRARAVCIRNLAKDNLDHFTRLGHVFDKAESLELDGLHISDMSTFPSLPKLQHLTLNGMRMWGGNMIVQRGQTAYEAFDDRNTVECLFKHVRYSSLMIEEKTSKLFPSAHIVVNFRIGYQVLDKNMMRGIQDWDWNCSYDVKTEKLEKKLAHRLMLW